MKRTFLSCLLLLLALNPTLLPGKPFVFEGFVDTAPTDFVAPISHVMRFDPAGKIELALIDPGVRLQSRPLDRVKILGELASDRTTNGVPVIRVAEVDGGQWSSGSVRFSRGTVANWDGFGSTLYPGIADEPLPQAGVVSRSSLPPFYLADPKYLNGAFQFRLHGAVGWTGIVDVSTNLNDWQPLFTNTIVEGGTLFSDPATPQSPSRIYRARFTAPE